MPAKNTKRKKPGVDHAADDAGSVRFVSPGPNNDRAENWELLCTEHPIRLVFMLNQREVDLYFKIATAKETLTAAEKKEYQLRRKNCPVGYLPRGPAPKSSGEDSANDAKKPKLSGKASASNAEEPKSSGKASASDAKEPASSGKADASDAKDSGDGNGEDPENFMERPYQQRIKTDLTRLPDPADFGKKAAKLMLAADKSAVDAGATECPLGIIRPVTKGTSAGVMDGFIALQKSFDPTRPVSLVPAIEGKDHAPLRKLYRENPAQFWHKAFTTEGFVEWLIVDGANRRHVCTELKITWMHACFLRPETSINEMSALGRSQNTRTSTSFAK